VIYICDWQPVFQSHMMMKAVRVHRFGGPEVLTLEHNVPIPEIRDNQVSVTVNYGTWPYGIYQLFEANVFNS
jgi:hypothetical protein